MKTYLVLFVVGCAVFSAFSGKRIVIHSADNHFVYLADAFLHGSVELQRPPHHQNDWASYEIWKTKGATADAHGDEVRGYFTRRKGKRNEFRLLSGEDIELPRRDRVGDAEKRSYVSFPPMPGVLMMPFVAAVGYGTNDVVFTILFAALNVLLAFVLLRHLARSGYSERSHREDLWLVVLFAFGSAHLWCSVRGQVWFTALVVGATFHLLYLLWAIDARRPFLAGLALAFGFATRATLVFAALFFYWQLLRPASGETYDTREKLRRFALFSAPCLVVGIALLWYNHARFANPFEFGHTYLAGGNLPRIRDFGLFHPEFINRNLTAAFTLTPRLRAEAPYIQFSQHGMSMLLTTPALLYLLWPRRRPALMTPLLVTFLVLFVPILLYQNTGWQQFGYRFALDFLPLLLCALAIGARPITRTFKALIVAGVLVNAFGAATWHASPIKNLYVDFECEEPRK